MKLAFVSDNGTTISRHFGRARQYLVVTLEEGQEVARETRVKGACHGHAHSAADEHHGADGHTHDDDHHDDMLAAIADCDVVITGGMGAGMDQRLRAAGIRAIRTRIQVVERAIQAFLDGELRDTIELVH